MEPCGKGIPIASVTRQQVLTFHQQQGDSSANLEIVDDVEQRHCHQHGAAQVARAQLVYSNNFQTHGSENYGLAAPGTLSGLTLTSLPTDNGGIGSANQSVWLGRNGYGVAKDTTPERATLSLGGLTAGQQYSVAFDLLIGSSWDGSAGFYGPDEFSLVASGTSSIITLIAVSAVVNQSVTPEPASLVLMATGLTGVGFMRRKRK